MMSEPRVRTRFAPSPTGYLHIGGVRTALFCWLFARRHGGQFVLRIDDTDFKRNVDKAISPILHGLKWLGIDWDEGPGVGGPHAPYYQSKRTDRHHKAVNFLLEAGNAYRDFATPEEIQAEREAAQREKRTFRYSRRWMAESAEDVARFESEGRSSIVRLKLPHEGQIVIDDLVRGRVEFDLAKEQDHVIQRADGTCLYHLASVVDDHDFEITHVIRAEEHLSNTPRQVFIAESLGYERPQYAHLPYVAEPGSKNKLSKRKLQKYLKNADFAKLMQRGREIADAIGLETTDETFNPVIVDFYEQVGYLPEAVVNYLLLLGWALDDSTEDFDRDAMIRHFSLERVNKAPASFDPAKLNAFQAHYMQVISRRDKTLKTLPYLQWARIVRDPAAHEDMVKLRQVLESAKERIVLLGDILDYASFFQADDAFPYDTAALEKSIGTSRASMILRKFRDHLLEIDSYDSKMEERVLSDIAESDSSVSVLRPSEQSTQRSTRSGIPRDSTLAVPFDASTLEHDIVPIFLKSNDLKLRELVHPLRVAITGRPVGLGIFDAMAILGKQSCTNRINRCLSKVDPLALKLPKTFFDIPEAIQPHIPQTTPSADVCLYEGRLRVRNGTDLVEGDASIHLSWLPEFRMRFTLNADVVTHIDTGEVDIEILGQNVVARALLTNIAMRPNYMVLSGILSESVELGDAAGMVSILCHFPGFHQYRGRPIRKEYKSWAGRADLDTNEWKLELNSVEGLSTLRRELQRHGGNAITHVARIERRDGTTFSATQVGELFHALQNYLSFARGYWIAPMLPFGFDSKGDQVWQEWGTRRTDNWSPVTSWCPVDDFEPIERFFAAFMQRWNDVPSKDVIQTAIYWYLLSTKGGAIDRSIVTAQIVIDLVADFALPETTAPTRPDTMDVQDSARKIHMLLVRLNVPSDIPENMAHLHTFAKRAMVSSGPEVLLRLRNAYVQPTWSHRELLNKSRDLDSKIYQAWKLALWYAELAILWLVGYEGKYVNRLTARYVGQSESVPWVSTQPESPL